MGRAIQAVCFQADSDPEFAWEDLLIHAWGVQGLRGGVEGSRVVETAFSALHCTSLPPVSASDFAMPEMLPQGF